MSLRNLISALVLGLPVLLLLVFGPRGRTEIPAGRTVVVYWEKWTLAEGVAIQRIVNRFNETVGAERGIWVDYTALGDVDKRMLIATAGGDPPDVAGISDRFFPQYAAQSALTPLDALVREFDIDLSGFKPIWLDICRYDDTLFALPSTPFTVALYYNRAHFRAAGLDPDRPPRTTAELNDFAERLTRFDRGDPGDPQDDRIVQLGFTASPSMLGWWHWAWPNFFDGRLWDGRRFALDTDAGRAAYAWMWDYRERVGNRLVLQFEGQQPIIESAQNPFLAGELSMVLQGPWLSAWAARYAPDLDYAVAPFPSVSTQRQHVLASTDFFVIPRNARRPREAMVFLKYMVSQPVLEELNRAHGKVSPFRRPQPAFYEGHVNPFVRVFDEMATSPYAFGSPPMPNWTEAWTETLYMTESIQRGVARPTAALTAAQEKIDVLVAQQERMAARRRTTE